MARSKKSRPAAVPRVFEALEERTLLSNGFDLASAQAFYPDFFIAEDAAVYEIAADDLSVEALKAAIVKAEQTAGDDLIVLHASEGGNVVAFDADSDSEFVIDVEGKGRLTVISWGDENGVTFDANQTGRLFCVQSGIFQLGGVTLTDGFAADSFENVSTVGTGGALANAGETVLAHVTVAGCSAGSKNESAAGSVYSRGGGLYNSATGKLILVDCRLLENVAESSGLNASNISAYGAGGALFNNGGTVMIRDSELSGNVAEAKTLSYTVVTGQMTETAYVSQEGIGGAVYSVGGNVSVEGGTFLNNSAYLGGAIAVLGEAVLTLTDVSLTGNSAKSDGGAVYSYSPYGALTAERCDFFANEAGRDGGAVYTRSAATFRNSVLSGNVAGRDGGALAFIGKYVGSAATTEFTLINCTVTGNSAGTLDEGNGGGVYFSGTDSSQTAAKLYVHNSILVNNRVVDSNLNADSNLTKAAALDKCYGYYSLTTFSGWTLGANNPVYRAEAPLFARDYNFDAGIKGDYRLVGDENSQAVDAGDNDSASPAELGENMTDIYGEPRIYHGAIDLGACEYQPTPFDDLFPSNLSVQQGCSFYLPSENSDADGNAVVRYLVDLENDGIYEFVGAGFWLSWSELNQDSDGGYFYLTIENSLGAASAPKRISVDLIEAVPCITVDAASLLEGRILKLSLDVFYFDRVVQEWTVDWGDGGDPTRCDCVSNSLKIAYYYEADAETQTYTVTLRLVDTNGGGGDVAYIIGSHAVPGVQSGGFNLNESLLSTTENDGAALWAEAVLASAENDAESAPSESSPIFSPADALTPPTGNQLVFEKKIADETADSLTAFEPCPLSAAGLDEGAATDFLWTSLWENNADFLGERVEASQNVGQNAGTGVKSSLESELFSDDDLDDFGNVIA